MGCQPICNCNLSMANTGTDCTPLIHVTKKISLIPIYDSTGVRNFIDLTATITEATFTAMINNTDTSKRLFPLPELKNINDKRNDAILQKFADDSTIYIRDGIRAFDGLIVGKNASPILKSKIEAARCGEVGAYLTDRLGNYIGIVSDDKTKLYPIRMDSESVAATYIKATDTEIQAMKVMFDFHPDEQDSCLGMVASTEMGDAKPLLHKGLLDITAVFTTPTITGVVVSLNTDFGTAKTPVKVLGLLIADFVSSVGGATSKVRNITTNLDVTLTTVTESTSLPGTYTLVWPVQTTGNKIVVLPKKAKYDFTGLILTPVTL